MWCVMFLLSHNSDIFQSRLSFTETPYNPHLPALACILTSTDIPQNLHADAVHSGGYDVRSDGDSRIGYDGRQIRIIGASSAYVYAEPIQLHSDANDPQAFAYLQNFCFKCVLNQ